MCLAHVVRVGVVEGDAPEPPPEVLLPELVLQHRVAPPLLRRVLLGAVGLGGPGQGGVVQVPPDEGGRVAVPGVALDLLCLVLHHGDDPALGGGVAAVGDAHLLGGNCKDSVGG